MKVSELGLNLRGKTPDELEALADVIALLSGGEIDDRPVHPVSKKRLDHPLSGDDMAAINHSQIKKYQGEAALLKLNCDCSYCVTLKA